ncbi:MAG: sulfite exporter TauE/SafE family protein [Bacillota bacterium]|nr:sulfite exporter TauE/SafE family protein [Bacillota bacterium]
MEEKLVQKVLRIDGMTCSSCETRIESAVSKLDGVSNVKAIYSSSNVYITYDINKLDIDKITQTIENLDYKVTGGIVREEAGNELKKDENKMGIGSLLGIGIIILAVYTIIKNTIGFNFIPNVDQSMGYGILFVIGLMTSLHCIAMCGGINLSVCMHYKSDNSGTNFARLKPSALYNIGRVLSYTLIGGIVGAIGSAVSFSGSARGIIAIISGGFMVIMGLNMLNIFPWLRKLNPRMPKLFGRDIHNKASKKGPLIVGILNALMPCGPLQAMQLYALGTGSFASGAISMFLFSMGTVPLMFGFGAVSSLLSGRFTRKMMKVSAVLVMLLGIIMLNRGLNLSGYNVSLALGDPTGNDNIAKIESGVQTVTTKLKSGSYSPIVVQKGIPVKWTIKADKENLNGCNNAITAQEFGIENKKLSAGDNLIEFTPSKEGNFVYTCWMGMLNGYVKVVDDIKNINIDDIKNDVKNYKPTGNPSNGGVSGGGC